MRFFFFLLFIIYLDKDGIRHSAIIVYSSRSERINSLKGFMPLEL